MKSPLLLFGYLWVVTLLRIMQKPYHEMRIIVFRSPLRVPVIMSPTLSLIALFIVGRVASYVFEVEGNMRVVVSIILGCILFCLLLWQILMILLLLRFVRARYHE